MCPPAVARAAADALDAIVAATGLRGLASADCLVDGEAWWLIEINPRPGATLDILDRRDTPLLIAHVEACLGRAMPLAEPKGAAACTIVHSRRAIPAAPDCEWPDHVKDRPVPGSRIAAGAPVCTVVAHGEDVESVLLALRRRVQAVRAALQARGSDHATAHSPAERQFPRSPAG
jgi:predicted ATP-grasp superfamily ATP-dependent carboligase